MDVRSHTLVADRSCDREPIHMRGEIQPHGHLLACTMPGWVVEQASAGLPAFLGLSPDELLGHSLDHLLPESIMHGLGNAATTVMMEPGSQQRIARGALGLHPVECDVGIYRSGNRLVVEIEPNPADPMRGQDPLALAQGMINRLVGADRLDAFYDRAVQQVRAMTGFDRVMLYRFEHDGSGRVIAEAHRSGMDSFLGLHYPASDIPRPARELYRRNRIRCIEDVDAAPVPLLQAPQADDTPLDLGQAGLRSVAPIHLQYLRNMGVGASMSVSVLVDGQLWGLIACHHRTPRRVPMDMRSAADLFGLFFSMQVAVREGEGDRGFEARARILQEELLDGLGRQVDPVGALQARLPALRRLMPCDGVGLQLDGQWSGCGELPPADGVAALLERLAGEGTRSVASTHVLAEWLGGGQDWTGRVSGMLALPISTRPGDYLFFFRREHRRTVTWAGDPKAPYSVDETTGELSPRASFEAWKETVKGQSAPWTQAELRVGERLRVALLELVLRHAEVSGEASRVSGERQRLLIAELNHRVKNLLALMQSLVMSSHESAANLHDFVENLEGRIRALAFAHDQITPRSGQQARLRALVESEVHPYRGRGQRISVEGPPLALDARAGTALALVLHEMATNAVKYGALGADDGQLQVRWSQDTDGNCRILWRESGGPVVAAPTHEGFGSTLIRRSIPFELRGEAQVRYPSGGVEADFMVPAVHVELVHEEAEADAVETGDLRLPGDQLSVLLVEDNMLIALDTEHLLQRLGAAQVEVASNVEEAVAFLDTPGQRVDVAVLDVNLGGENSVAIAERLAAQGRPFIFATGYHDRAMIPPAHAGVPVIRKPFTAEGMARAIQEAVAGVRPSPH